MTDHPADEQTIARWAEHELVWKVEANHNTRRLAMWIDLNTLTPILIHDLVARIDRHEHEVRASLPGWTVVLYVRNE